MSFLSISCVLIAASPLVYLGATYLKRASQRDKTFGFALCLSSLFAIFYGGASLFEMDEERGQPQLAARILIGVAAVVAWGATIFYALQHPASLAAVKRLSAGLVVLFVTWITLWDSLINWFDLFLLVAFAAWLGAEGMRYRDGKRARLSSEKDEATDKPWKRSA